MSDLHFRLLILKEDGLHWVDVQCSHNSALKSHYKILHQQCGTFEKNMSTLLRYQYFMRDRVKDQSGVDDFKRAAGVFQRQQLFEEKKNILFNANRFFTSFFDADGSNNRGGIIDFSAN